MSKPQSITALPESPDAERHRRMIRYGITMGIRVVCLALCLVAPGWWILLPAAGAVLLPWFAVVLANERENRAGGAVERPGGLLRSPGDSQ